MLPGLYEGAFIETKNQKTAAVLANTPKSDELRCIIDSRLAAVKIGIERATHL
jgi:hypothetical protein